MISVFGSQIGKTEIDNVVECMNSQWMGFGKNVEKFEIEFKKKLQLKNFCMLDSGSNALFMAVTLLNLPKNSEIILPSFTWVSCAQSILMAGHKPIFCDVDIDTMNVRKEDIIKHISKNTAAIMVVDYAGLPIEMDSIQELDIPIIEDAAHAVHSLYKGNACGSLADIAIYSFDSVKNLAVGEGGGITAKDDELINRAKTLRYCGIGKSGFDKANENDNSKSRWWEYDITEPFIKMLPTNISGAIGIAQLSKLEKLQNIRKRIWDIYQREFSNIDCITTPVDANDSDRHSFFTFCIKVPKRDELAKYLFNKGIYTTLRYHPLHLNSLYKQTDKKLINTEKLNDIALSIPLHPRLNDDDIDKVINSIKSFYI
tara:strand:- start:1275 stop:2387 length:1113 start_codon:yes stop_codon:yes gene_type:complete